MKVLPLDPRKAPMSIREKLNEMSHRLMKEFPRDRYHSLVLVTYPDFRDPTNDLYFVNMAASTDDQGKIISYLRAIVAAYDERMDLNEVEPTDEKPTAIH